MPGTGAAAAPLTADATADEDSCSGLPLLRLDRLGTCAPRGQHEGRIFSCAYARDGDGWLATACEDGTIGIWESGHGSKGAVHEAHEDEVLRLAWDPAAPSVLYSGGSEGTIQTWSFDQEEMKLESTCKAHVGLGEDDGQVYGLVQGRDNLVVAHDDRVTLMDKLDELKELLTFRFHAMGGASVGGPRNPENRAFVFDSAITNASDQTLCVALSDGTVRLRDLRSPARDAHAWQAHETHVTCCAIDRSGQVVSSGSGDGDNCVWDLRTLGGEVKRPRPVVSAPKQGSAVYGTAFWPEKSKLAVSWGASGLLTVMDTSREEHALLVDPDVRSSFTKRRMRYPVYSVAFSGCGGNLAVAGGCAPDPPPSKSTGFRPWPSEGEGCLRVARELNPWMLLDTRPILAALSGNRPDGGGSSGGNYANL